MCEMIICRDDEIVKEVCIIPSKALAWLSNWERFQCSDQPKKNEEFFSEKELRGRIRTSWREISLEYRRNSKFVSS